MSHLLGKAPFLGDLQKYLRREEAPSCSVNKGWKVEAAGNVH